MKKILVLIIGLFFAMSSQSQTVDAADLENTLYMELRDDRVVIKMLPEVAPKHVERIKKLSREGFYDGLAFHRVMRGFMAQGGDPRGDGTGGSEYPDLPAEFSDEPHTRGAASMARSRHPDSANSQFFIVTDDSRFLDGQYTLWGRVVQNMEAVDKIKKGSDARNGEVHNPDKILCMRVAADVENGKAKPCPK